MQRKTLLRVLTLVRKLISEVMAPRNPLIRADEEVISHHQRRVANMFLEQHELRNALSKAELEYERELNVQLQSCILDDRRQLASRAQALIASIERNLISSNYGGNGGGAIVLLNSRSPFPSLDSYLGVA